MTDNSIGKKLMEAELHLSGLPDGAYKFAKYIAPLAIGNLAPEQLVMLIAVALDDIATGHYTLNHFETPQYLLHHEREVLNEAEKILLIIDAIAEPAFSLRVRLDCRVIFGWALPVQTSPFYN